MAATKKDLLNALKFIAIMPQAYYAKGPEWLVREMARVATESARIAESK